MKNTIVLFFIMTAYLFSQGWNNTVTTTINEPNLVKMDLFTNKDGNHIIVQNSNSTNSIKYYLLNSAGTVVRSSTIETSGGAEFPNISGDNDKVYLVYKLGSNLKSKKSTNAGVNWSDINPSLSIGSNTCNGVDIVYGYGGLHVVYAMKDSDPYYETYYYKLDASNSWVDYKNVTDYDANEVGGLATVTVSENRVHVGYNTAGYYPNPGNTGTAKTRDKNGTNWETPQTVLSSPSASGAERIQIAGTTLYDFYYLMIAGGGQFYYNLYYKTRGVGQTQWSSGIMLGQSVDIATLMNSTSDYDQNAHIIYQDDGIYHKSSANWNTSDLVSTDFLYYSSIGFSSAGNDLFATWKPQGSSNIKFRQYDASPLAPTSLAVNKSVNNHPLLTWTKNNEPDVVQYKVYKKITAEWGWQYLTTVATNSFEDLTEFYPTPGQGGFTHYVYYRVTAVDLHPFESPNSNEVFAKVGGAPLDKVINGDNSNVNFSLSQNYPNPFNPSTVISYSIPFDGNVKLRVFNMLGEMVSELVNQTQSQGKYDAFFDGSNLASGMYFYSIEAISNDGSQNLKVVKKMLQQK